MHAFLILRNTYGLRMCVGMNVCVCVARARVCVWVMQVVLCAGQSAYCQNQKVVSSPHWGMFLYPEGAVTVTGSSGGAQLSALWPGTLAHLHQAGLCSGSQPKTPAASHETFGNSSPFQAREASGRFYFSQVMKNCAKKNHFRAELYSLKLNLFHKGIVCFLSFKWVSGV